MQTVKDGKNGKEKDSPLIETPKSDPIINIGEELNKPIQDINHYQLVKEFFKQKENQEEIEMMISEKRKFFKINGKELSDFNPAFLQSVKDNPEKWMTQFNIPISEYFKDHKIDTLDDEQISIQIQLDESSIITNDYLNKLVVVEGKVSEVPKTKPKPFFLAFECRACGNVLKEKQELFSDNIVKPTKCTNPNCNNSRSWKMNREHSQFIYSQLISLQRLEEDTFKFNPIEVLLNGDLVDSVKAGDIAQFTGIYVAYETKSKGNLDYKYSIYATSVKIIESDPEIYFKPPSLNQLAQDYTISRLETKGKFLIDEKKRDSIYGIHYLSGFHVFPIHSDLFLKLIPPDITDTGKKDDFLNRILSRSRTRKYTITNIHNRFYYDTIKNQIYISDRYQGYYLLNESDILHYSNGDNEIYFAYESNDMSLNIDNIDKISKSLIDFYDRFKFLTEDGLNHKQHCQYLYGKLLSVVFESKIKQRPILIYEGEPSAGKTTLAREEKRFLYGPDKNVDKIDPKDPKLFKTIITSDSYCSWDNLEQATKEMTDDMCSASTGSSIPFRELYTTRKLDRVNTVCWQIATCVNFPSSRTDLLTRCIFVKLQSKGYYESIDIYSNSEIIHQYFWCFLVDLQKALKYIPSIKSISKGRFPDFEGVLKCTLKAINVSESEINYILTKTNETADSKSHEEDTILNALEDLVNGVATDENSNLYIPFDFGPDSAGITIKELMKIMERVGLTDLNEHNLRKRLNMIMGNCRKFGIIIDSYHSSHGRMVYYHIFSQRLPTMLIKDKLAILSNEIYISDEDIFQQIQKDVKIDRDSLIKAKRELLEIGEIEIDKQNNFRLKIFEK
jgi:hypothetical protein